MKKNVILGGAVLLTIFVVSMLSVYLSGKELLIGSESISDEMPTSSDTFAIMVENDDGDYEEYTESETWPSGMVFNSSMSFCQDKDGATIEESLTYSNGYATLTSSDTSYCWLYFRNYGTTATLDSITVTLSSGTTYTCTSTSCTYEASSSDTTFNLTASVSDDSYASFYFSNATSTVYSTSATSSNYTLTTGSTKTATVKVTSEDGSTTKTYTINVKKPSNVSTATITSSTGTWAATCSGSTTSCTLTLTSCASGSSATSVTLTATATNSAATLGWSTKTVSVACGATTPQTLLVTAEDGSTTTYTINVIRPSYTPASSSSSSSSGGSATCVTLVYDKYCEDTDFGVYIYSEGYSTVYTTGTCSSYTLNSWTYQGQNSYYNDCYTAITSCTQSTC